MLLTATPPKGGVVVSGPVAACRARAVKARTSGFGPTSSGITRASRPARHDIRHEVRAHAAFKPYDAAMTEPAFPRTADAAQDNLLLDGPAGALEVAVDLPADDVDALPAVAIICHPLPTEGGTMHNKVVTITARALRELGVATVRFNFRGTGKSQGKFDDGNGESDDLRKVAAWVRAQRPDVALWLAGFSFGAYVSLRMAAELQPALLISIAPPVGRSYDFAKLVPPTCPWLVIQGDADEVVDPEAVFAWVESLPETPELVRMPGASHFFHRKLMDLRGAVKHGVRAWLPVAGD